MASADPEAFVPCLPPSTDAGNGSLPENPAGPSPQDLKRLRELFKYFSSTCQAIGYPDIDIESINTYNANKARISSDPILNALAQLASWKLSCDRAFISLIDSEHQYVIAESTRRISLYETEHHPLNEGVCIGARPLDLVSGVCAGTMPAFLDTNAKGPYFSSSNIYADKTRYIINDFTLEDKYKDRPYVTGYPYMRYYAEVPIKSPVGHVLGTLAVVDNKPRIGIEEEQFFALTEIAATIMVLLQKIKIEQDHIQASRLLQGLNYFVQGNHDNDKSFSGGSLNHKVVSPDILNGNRTTSQNNSQVVDGPRDLSPVGYFNESDSLVASHASPSTNLKSSISESIVTRNSSKSAVNTKPTIVLTSNPLNNINDESLSSREHLPETYQNGVVNKAGSCEDAQLRDVLVSNEIRTTFSNASHILREAMDLDGVIFLDAALIDYASRSVSHKSAVQFSLSSPSGPDPSSSEDSEDDYLGHTSLANSYSNLDSDGGIRGSPHTERNAQSDSRMSGRLGYSLKNKADGVENVIFSEHFSIPEVLHLSLLHHYPKGHIFDFDRDSTASIAVNGSRRSSTKADDSNLKVRRKLMKRRDIKIAIQTALPDTRSAIFLPLWNPHKECWFAGGIGWTKEPKRVLQSLDLGYFSVFGNSIMADVTRLELISSDRAKSNFISSISHELRSPLHGILGGAELLRDAATNSNDRQMISMVENCGRTMLDTMDHILDFAKISTVGMNGEKNITRSSAKLGAKFSADSSSEHAFRLDQIIEEIVQSLVAGYQYKSASASRLLDLTQPQDYATIVQQESSVANRAAKRGAIVVIIDVDKQLTWKVQSEIAAWRRIILNLVGNALKYTTEGLIEIELRLNEEDTAPSKGKSVATFATLKVRDTGLGIGKAYLQTHLYTPFMQENDLSEGTGLGLSIIQKVVHKLNGNMDVKSERGIGTEVEVIIPLSITSVSPIIAPSLKQDATICLLGFNIYPDLNEAPTGVLSRAQKSKIALKNILEQYAKVWLGMNVQSALDISSVQANIVVVCDTDLHLLYTEDSDGVRTLTFPEGLSLIIVSTAAEGQNSCVASISGRFQYLTQPVGPYKTIEVISTALQADTAGTVTASEIGDLFLHELKTTDHSQQTKLKGGTEINGSAKPTEEISPSIKTLVITNSEDYPDATDPQIKPVFLLVDDNAINLKLLVEYVKKLKCEYLCANDGQKAVQVYKDNFSKINYVLMDVSMPVMNGFEATRAIRGFEERNGLQATPVIALTGLGSATAQQEAVTSGVNIFLTKPVPMKMIKNLVEHGLSSLR